MSDGMTIDDLTVIGIDGIRRSFDEHYDTMMEVGQDPTGAHHAIQNQHARIEELEAKLAKAMQVIEMIASADVDAVLGEAVDISCEIIGELMEEEEGE